MSRKKEASNKDTNNISRLPLWIKDPLEGTFISKKLKNYIETGQTLEIEITSEDFDKYKCWLTQIAERYGLIPYWNR